jgi:hypothetical protein
MTTPFAVTSVPGARPEPNTNATTPMAVHLRTEISRNENEKTVVLVVLVLVVLVLVVLVVVVGGRVVVVVGGRVVVGTVVLAQSKPRALLSPLFWACASHARALPVEPLSLGPTPLLAAPADTKLVPVNPANATQAIASSRFKLLLPSVLAKGRRCH